MKPATTNFLFAIAFFGALSLFKLLDSSIPFLSTQHIPVPGQSKDNSHLSFTNRNSDDHLYYSQNAGNLLEKVGKSDILLLGNSRMLMGIEPKQVEAWTEKTGLRLYNFSFDHGEGHAFPFSIIKGHGLRPKYIVANLDTYFFSKSITPHGQAALASTSWDARKSWLNFPMATHAQGTLHHFLPKFRLLDKTPAVAYRSNLNGGVYLHLPDERGTPFTFTKTEITVLQEELETAKSIHAWCKAQGIQLHLTQVPNPSPTNLDLEEFSKLSGIPSIPIKMEVAESFDNSHLTRKSAREFTRLLLEKLAPLAGQGKSSS